MQEVIFHRLAGRELRSAVAWYGGRSEQARRRFGQAVRDAVQRIVAAPQAHAVVSGPHRFVRVRRFPYVLIFEVREDGTILIVAVAHTSRRPGYWRRRK